MKNNGASVYREAFWLGLVPDKKMTVSQWSDEHRILSPVGSAEPGPWRTDRTPYLREIMDAFSPDSPIEEIIVKKGAQIGYSESLVNFLGFIIDVTSGPALVVQPTVDLAKKFSKQRVDPLVELCERVGAKVSDPRARDSGNTVLAKEFPGGILVMTGANSAVGLRSMPARFLLLDEVDAYPDDADGEGDPIMLAKARTRTFGRRKVIMGSTPTFEGRSKIDFAFQETDQRYYHVPCPHCGFLQKITWEKIRWPKGEPEKACLECIECKAEIQEHNKTKMLAGGTWVPENPDHKNPRMRGYHISSLYSPIGWYSWAQAAKDFIAARDKPELLRGFVNTVLGEVWKEPGEAPDWKRLYDRRETYRIGQVPYGPVFLTAGADVQKDRIEVEVVGWGFGKESWSIDYRVFHGETSVVDRGAWLELDKFIGESFETENGISLPIRMMAVDSGYSTQTVYNWCRKYPMNRVIATKGSETAALLVGKPSPVDVKINGQRIRRGFRVWTIGVNIAKTELYGWLGLEKPIDGEAYPEGYCHFPEYEDEFFKQLTAEVVREKAMRGFKKHVWEKTRERNEALDVRVLNRVAASVLGMDRMKKETWEDLAGEVGVIIGAPKKVESPNEEVVSKTIVPQPVEPKMMPRRKSTYL